MVNKRKIINKKIDYTNHSIIVEQFLDLKKLRLDKNKIKRFKKRNKHFITILTRKWKNRRITKELNIIMNGDD